MKVRQTKIWRALRFLRRFYTFWRLHGKNVNKIETIGESDADVFIVSFPKSGRSWLRVLLSRYFLEIFPDSSNLEHFDLYAFSRDQKGELPVISFTHDGSSFKPVNLPAWLISGSKQFYTKKKVILLVRDPRDTVVSYFYHVKYRSNRYPGTISEFIRDPFFGVLKIISFLNAWAKFYEAHSRDNSVLLVRYEDMRQSPYESFSQIIGFLGLRMHEVSMRLAIEDSTLEKMKQQSKSSSIKILAPQDKNDERSYKVRSGKVGGYVKEFNDKDLAFLADSMKALSKLYNYE